MSNLTATRPAQLAKMQTLDAVRGGTGFDPEAWHVMEARDNALIADEILNGAGSSKFVYQFDISGKAVAGISVIGARHLVSHYGGIKHRLVGSISKIGMLFTFTSYPQPGMPMAVQVSVIPELEQEDDFYGSVVEVTDLKTGNSIQAEKRETRYERRQNGTIFERPHYSVIAQSKAYRNAVLALIPQDVQIRWKAQQLALGKDELITGSVMEEKRAAVLRFAGAKGIPLDRRSIEQLTTAQIIGLSDAAREGQAVFVSSAVGLGLMAAAEPTADSTPALPAKPAGKAPAPPPRARAAAPAAPPAATAEPDPVPPAGADSRADYAAARQTGAATSPAADKWIGYLVDEYGEMQGDPYPDPISYAMALKALWDREGVRKAELLDANSEWIAEVLAMGEGRAHDIIRDMQLLTEPAEEAGQTGEADRPMIRPVELTQGARGPSWPPYVKALKESLGTIDAAHLATWAEVNFDTIRQAPDAQRLLIIKAVQDHANAVGGQVPAIIQGAVEGGPTGRADQPDPDMTWAQAAVREIEAMPSKNALLLYAGSTITQTKMTRFAATRQDLFQLIDAAIVARQTAFDASDFPGDRL